MRTGKIDQTGRIIFFIHAILVTRYFYQFNRSGILTIQTMHLLKKKYSSMDKYLETETGIPPAFYPTFLGLRLAEDFELGTK